MRYLGPARYVLIFFRAVYSAANCNGRFCEGQLVKISCTSLANACWLFPAQIFIKILIPPSLFNAILTQSKSLASPASNHEFFIPIVIGDQQFVGSAAHLAVFNIFLGAALRRVHKGVVDFTAVGTSEFCSLWFALVFHGLSVGVFKCAGVQVWQHKICDCLLITDF